MPSITIIEDDAAIASLLKYKFEAEGYVVHLGSDGAEAVTLIRQTQPEAIILDINLPNKSGFDIAETLRADRELSTLPILMLTAQADIESRLKGLEHADDYLVKPFALQELEARIKALLRRSAVRQPRVPHVAELAGVRVRHYDIERELGKGATAIVYKAYDSLLERDVVLKFFTEVAYKPQFKERFMREAKVMSSLKHPHITEVYSVDELESGHLFMVMPYLLGQSLEVILKDRRSSVSECLRWSQQVLSGLVQAHHQGVIHRDIKPGNIFITQTGEAKVLDFGVAKLLHPDNAELTSLTQDGSLIGTINYMSPEQIRSQELDETVDCWGVAVVMYEMLAGRRPFVGTEGSDIFSIIDALIHQEPETLRRVRQDVPADLETVIFKALAKNKASRFTSSADMLQALEAIRIEVDG